MHPSRGAPVATLSPVLDARTTCFESLAASKTARSIGGFRHVQQDFGPGPNPNSITITLRSLQSCNGGLLRWRPPATFGRTGPLKKGPMGHRMLDTSATCDIRQGDILNFVILGRISCRNYLPVAQYLPGIESHLAKISQTAADIRGSKILSTAVLILNSFLDLSKVDITLLLPFRVAR